MDKIHKTWNELQLINDDWADLEGYLARINKIGNFNHIPKEVFKQWIHCLHQDFDTLNNYAWMNYENITFELCSWSFEDLSKIYIINKFSFRDLVKGRSSCDDFSQFCCKKEDIEYWKTYGTWRIPPIILDVKSINYSIPEHADINGLYQLVEGHNRIGYLHSMYKISYLNKGKIAKNHLVYIMKIIN